MWILAVILVVALMIPVAAILVDSPLGRSIARRLDSQGEGGGGSLRQLERRIEALEGELEDLNRSLAGACEEIQFMQHLLEDPRKKRKPS